jgi:gamma-glutamyltranspeptidase/glutathione hydrolase
MAGSGGPVAPGAGTAASHDTVSVLLLRNGRPVAALGTPGGDQQDQWQLIYLVRTLALGLDPQEAIDAPAFHTTAVPSSFWPRTWTPGGLVIEERVGGAVIDELRERGHDVTVSGPWSQGRLSVVTRDPDSGVLQAAANPRGAQGYAAGR